MTLPGALSVAVISLVAAACFVDDHPLASNCAKPSLIAQSVTGRSANVLSAFASVRTRDADSVIAAFGAGPSSTQSTSFTVIVGDSARVPILGLAADTRYEVQLSAVNRCGSTKGALMSFTTGSLPADLPSYAATGTTPDSGYIAFASGSYGIVIDNSGRVVWYYRFTNGPGLNFQAQPNGRYTARPNTAPGVTGNFIEIDPLGDTTRTLTCANGLQPRMHDMVAEADGSYWLMCDETRTVDLSSQGRSSTESVTGTSIQHLSRDGAFLFSWSPFDHISIDLSVLDPADRTATPINWTHGNAIDLSGDGNVIVSYRNLSEVLNIDTKTGSVLWRLGGRSSSFTFDNSASPPFRHQHGARYLSGEILLLDNLGEGATSRAERYRLDMSSHTAHLAASFAAPQGVLARLGGSTQSLGNHTLVAFGNGGGLDEYDSAGDVVWHVIGNAGYVFRAQRIRSLYRPGVGDPR